jgi:hypothetical protein
MRAHRLDFNDSQKGRVQVTKTRAKALGVVVHFTSGTGDGVPNSVNGLVEYGLGYQCIISHGVIWTLAGALQVVSHARGYNSSHIGIALKHEGLRTRAIAGQTVPAFHRKTGKAMHQRHYDPLDLEASAYHVASLLRTYCGGPDKSVADRILFHDELDTGKNDPGPAFPRTAWVGAVERLVMGGDPPDFTKMEPEGFPYEEA